MTPYVSPFLTVTQAREAAPGGYANVAMGERNPATKRYKMPLLPGEAGTKAGGDWVPGGMQSVTNLIGAFSESWALGIWMLEQTLVGLVRQHSLYEELALLVHKADAAGVNWRELKQHPEVRKALSGTWNDADSSLAGRARQAAGANEARQAGTNRHDAWEHRALTGELIGTPDIRSQILALEELLKANHLERVPGLQERTIRHTGLNVAGRYDDIVRNTLTGQQHMADLKTKRKPFWTWMETDAQLATYADADLMLTPDGNRYEERCPRDFVDQERGVVLQMPSNGGPPYLRTAWLEHGRGIAALAREVTERRAYGKSAERGALAPWVS